MTEIRVELHLADGTFTSGMLRAGQSVKEFQAQLVRTNPELQRIAAGGGNVIRSMHQMDVNAKSFLGTLRDMSIIVGIASAGITRMVTAANGWAGEIVRVNSEMERLSYQMRAMSTKKDPFKDAADNVRYLRQQATQMPFSLKAITNSFTKLKATGIDPTKGSLQAIADGIAAFGGTDEQLHRVTIGLTQMASKGVIQMEELRQQVGEHMPVAMRLMARSMGISVGELTKEISTGTVSATAALQKFYDELERTYGGSAQRMMQTFSGQVAQLKTNLQNLATAEGGAAVFGSIKDQLRDINDFLQTDVAKVIAADIGNAITSFITSFREAIGWVWQFRDALAQVATLAVTGFGLMLAGRALQGFASMAGNASVALGMLRINMREAVSNMALGMTGFRSLSTAGVGARFAVMGAGQAFGSLLAGLSAFGPAAIIVGVGVIALADHFDLLGTKIQESYEKLEKYGASTRAEAVRVQTEYIAKLKADIEEFENMPWWKGNRNTPVVQNTLSTWRGQLAKAEENFDDINQKAADVEDAAAMARLERRLSDEEEAIRSKRAADQMANDEQYKDELANYEALGKSKKEVDEAYRTRLLAIDTKASEDKIRIYRDEIDQLAKLRESADEDEQRQALKGITRLREKINSENQKIRANDPSRFGVEKLASPDGGAKAIASGEKSLDRLNRDIAGLQANLAGANDAVAEMNRRIAAGDFGTIEEGGEAVQALHDKLVAATQAKEILDELTRGDKKAEEDLNRLRQEALEDQMDLKLRLAGGDEMTNAEKYIFRLNNGAYSGLGSSIDMIRTSIEDVIKTMDLQGKAANQIGSVLRDNTFGRQSVDRVNSVYEAVHRLTMEINNLGSGLGGLSFQNFSTFATGIGNAVMGGLQPVFQDLPEQVTGRMQQAMTYLMQKGWSKTAAAGIVGNLVGESNMNPSAVGDNGNAFGLAQWNDRGPAMKAYLSGQGKQWNDFFGQLDFLDHELRTSESKAGSQLALAKDAKSAADIVMRLYERPADWAMRESGPKRAGAAVQAFNMAPGAGVPAAPSGATPIPTYESVTESKEFNDLLQQRVTRTRELAEEAREVVKLEKENITAEQAAARKDYLDDLVARTENAGSNLDELGANYKRLVSAVSKGKLGDSIDIGAEEYRELVAAAKEFDAVEEEISDKRKALRTSDRELKALEEQRLEINRAIAEQRKLAADPNYKPDSSALTQMQSDLDSLIENRRRAYGEDSAEYKRALEYKATMLRQQRLLEATTERAALTTKTRDMNTALLNQTQARQMAMQQELAAIDAQVERWRAAGMSEIEITETTEAAKAAIRAKYGQQMSPMQKQFQQWGDLQGNLQKASAKWMGSLADGLTNLIMGTGDLRSVLQGILKDMVNMGLKYMMSQMFGGNKSGGSGGKKGRGYFPPAPGGGKKGGKAAMTTLGAFLGVPVAHTGGIVGSRALMKRSVSPAAFIGAPKFHTGGIIRGPMLSPGEVPIIAKRGEGVFTPEQMDAMGGMQQNQQIAISAPITVNGSAGTPEQNNDLAKKMAKEMETSMRGVVADEVRRQSRPGNFLNSRGR